MVAVPFFLAGGGGPRDGGCEAFRPVSEGGLRGGLFGETVFLWGGQSYIFYNIFSFSRLYLLVDCSFPAEACVFREPRADSIGGLSQYCYMINIKIYMMI